MSSSKIRCHPTIILEKTFKAFVSAALLLFFLAAAVDNSAILSVLAVLLIALLLFYYRQWKRTTIQFNETDVVIERDTLFQKKTTLPYAKMASVNVNRDIPNRLFGTSKVLININSGASAMTPEAVLTFRQDVAERLRSEVSQRLDDHAITPEEEETVESLAVFTPMDVILHGVLSVSTYQTLLGSIFLAYPIFELSCSLASGTPAGGRAMVSLLMFVTVLVVPSISLIFRYYNYKIYRRGDTVYLQHGLIRTYRTSFTVSRINAIRIKSPLVARLLGKSCIEAEVVGLVSEGGERSRPVICLLKDDAIQQRVLRDLVPEFVYERKPIKQPESARYVLMMRAAVVSLAVLVLSAYGYRAVGVLAGTPDGVLQYMLPPAVALVIFATLYAAHVAYRITEFDAGEDLFTFVNGAVDRETTVMNYDRVQMVWITQGPIARIFGLSRGIVYMLSSMGGSSVTSGYFPGSCFEGINEIVMTRIARGGFGHREERA